jgi:hypothetical protein
MAILALNLADIGTIGPHPEYQRADCAKADIAVTCGWNTVPIPNGNGAKTTE